MDSDKHDLSCREVVWAIAELTKEEGSSVTIHSPNADFGGPSFAIGVRLAATDIGETLFTGESLLECLRKALAANHA